MTRSETSSRPWSRKMLRNPRVVGAGVLAALSCVPLVGPWSTDTSSQLAAYLTRILLVAWLVFCLERKIHRLRQPRERAFWHEVSLAFVCALASLAAEALFLTTDPSVAAAILLATLSSAPVVILIYAVEAAPHREERTSLASRQDQLNRAAVLAFLCFFVAYFDLAAQQVADSAELLSDLALPGVLYTYLCVRLIRRARDSNSPRWRRLYGLMAWAVGPVAALFLLAVAQRLVAVQVGGDGFVLRHDAPGLALSPLWLLSWIAWVLAAESRYLALPSPRPPRSVLKPITHGTSSSFFILVAALALPCLHLALSNLGWLAEAVQTSRLRIVTASLAALGAIALSQHWIIRQSSNELLLRRARAESALRKSEASVRLTMHRQSSAKELKVADERFAKFFRSSPSALLISTLDSGRIVEANQHFAHLSGYAVDEMQGETVHDLNLWNDPNGHHSMVNALQQGKLRNRMLKLRCKDGTLSTVELSGELLDVADEPCLLAVLRDVSEREQGRELLVERRAWRRHLEHQQRLGCWPDASNDAPVDED